MGKNASRHATESAQPIARVFGLFLNVLMLSVIGSMAVLAPGMAKYRYGPYDAAVACFFDAPASTTWAPGFEDSRFSRVAIGMTEAEVSALLGPPLDVRKATWRYSRAIPLHPGYHLRTVTFEDGGVTEVWREYRLVRW